MYFYLNSNCVFVSGTKKSAIYDFSNNKLYGLDDISSDLLRKSENVEEVDHVYDKFSIFKDLEKENLGFVSERKCFVDKVRISNPLVVKRTDLNPPKIHISYIRLNNKCRGKCEICNKMFCPICLCNDNDKNTKELTYNQWISIIDRLSKTGLQSITFTGGDPLLYKDIDKLVDYVLNKNISVAIVTPGIENIPSTLSRNITIFISAFENRDFKSILDKFKDFKILSIESIDYDISNKIKSCSYKNINIEKVNIKEHIITKDMLTKFDLSVFSGRKYFDYCLYGKVFVNYDGNIVPCFNDINNTIGSALSSEFTESMNNLIQNYWYSQSSREKCVKCEYFYACSSCRYTNDKENCRYNPDKGIWEY